MTRHDETSRLAGNGGPAGGLVVASHGVTGSPWEGRGGRPSASSRLKVGDDSITFVKLTISEASVRAVTEARASSRPQRPVRATRAAPIRAPALLAPVSPSMLRPDRSSGRATIAAPAVAAAVAVDRRVPGRPEANGTTSSRTTFSALPGRRSKRLTTLAEPAITAPPTSVVNGPVARV